jgi:lysophospholipase L1-like esterase
MTLCQKLTRRSLLQGTALAGALSATAPLAQAGHHGHSKTQGLLSAGNTILFQGDSITDAGRDKKNEVANKQQAFGRGYAWMAASQLLISQPEKKYTIHNRGISGNKVHQLDARWDKDCLQLKPDVLSILIGVNDIWHGLNGRYDGTVKTYEDDYRKLIARTKKQMPKVKLVICEPFVSNAEPSKTIGFQNLTGIGKLPKESPRKTRPPLFLFKACLMKPLNMLSQSIGQVMACTQVLMGLPLWLISGSKRSRGLKVFS